MPQLRLIRRDPNKGYIGRNLWLPKAQINVRSVKRGLEFPVNSEAGIEYLQLWKSDGDHLVVPRAFFPPETYEDMDFPIVSSGPVEFPKIRIESNVTLDFKDPSKTTQQDAFAAMLRSSGGLLNLACVAGDTKVPFNRAGKGFSCSISHAARAFNDGSWDKEIPTFVRSNKDGVIGLHEVKGIVCSGRKKTFKLVLEDGKTLRLTKDHEVLTTKGWVQLQHLTVGDLVITDGKREGSARKPKRAYKRLSWYACHPFARKQVRKTGKIDYQIEEHRAVAEAALNGMSLADYRARCKAGEIDGLRFIDPSKYHVHHIDEDITNNDPANLEVLPAGVHLGKHRPGAKAFGYGIPTPVAVKKIEAGKFEPVYDIICEDPHRNFVANGIVVHNCGKGKTCLALHYIAHKSVPALVIVNNTTLIDQWAERIEEHLGYVEGGVGVIQGPPSTWDWEGRGIVLAMIHSLSLRVDEVPPGMDRYFGLVVYDEVHHLSAPLFIRTAPLFYGERQGLTATVNREDGLEPIYQYHVGDVYHRDLMQKIKPRFYVQECPVRVNLNDDEVRKSVYDKAGKLNIPLLRTYLGTLPECNEFVAGKLRALLDAGRKILVLSHSKDQLQLLNSMFDNSGLCTGSEKPAKRIETLRTKQLTFGTLQLVKEALDEPTLDTLYVLTPFGSRYVEDGGFGTLQQGMGRLQREKEGKKTPLVIFLDHIYIQKFHQMISHLKRMIRRWPEDQGGPYDYKILRP